MNGNNPVVVYDATVFVCKRPKTEDVCNGFIVVIVNDVRAHRSPICGARIWRVRDVWLDVDRHIFNYWHRYLCMWRVGSYLGLGAPDALAWALHVAFCPGCAWI